MHRRERRQEGEVRTAAPVDACCSPVAHACMSVINLTNALTNLAETIYAAASPGPPSPFPHETPTARSRASRSCSTTASRSAGGRIARSTRRLSFRSSLRRSSALRSDSSASATRRSSRSCFRASFRAARASSSPPPPWWWPLPRRACRRPFGLPAAPSAGARGGRSLPPVRALLPFRSPVAGRLPWVHAF